MSTPASPGPEPISAARPVFAGKAQVRLVTSCPSCQAKIATARAHGAATICPRCGKPFVVAASAPAAAGPGIPETVAAASASDSSEHLICPRCGVVSPAARAGAACACPGCGLDLTGGPAAAAADREAGPAAASEPLPAFLERARAAGYMSEARARECLRIHRELAAIGQDLTVDAVAEIKGFVTEAQSAEIRKAIAAPAPAVPAPAPAPAEPGGAGDELPPSTRLGRYRIEAKIGEGGMGVVYRATDVETGRPVALKLMGPEVAADPEFRARFVREASLLAKLSHPHIVSCYEARQMPDGRLYIALALIDGAPLDRLSRMTRIAPREAIRIARAVCEALVHVHGLGIVHRDVKPSNILVAGDGHVYLSDFGIAKVRARPGVTEVGSWIGTHEYIAPEQRRDSHKATPLSDIYSLGVTLYELLTGQLPVGNLKRPSQLVPDLDPRLDAIVLRCLEPIPEQRFSCTDDLLRALVAVDPALAPSTAATPKPVAPPSPPVVVSAPPASPPARAPAHVHRRPLVFRTGDSSGALLSLAIVGLLAALVTGVWLGLVPREAPREKPPAHETDLVDEPPVLPSSAFPEEGGRPPPRVLVDAMPERTSARRVRVSGVAEPAPGASLARVEVNGVVALHDASGRFAREVAFDREGPFELRVMARDALGLQTVERASIVVDWTPPKIELRGPAPDSWVATVSAALTIGVSADAVAVTVGAGAPIPAPPPGKPLVTTVSLVEGPNTIVIAVRDDLNNRASIAVTLNRDTTAPAIRVDPLPVLVRDTAEIELTGTVSEDGCTVTVDDEVVAVAGWRFAGKRTLAPGDTRTFRIVARDRAGNESTASAGPVAYLPGKAPSPATPKPPPKAADVVVPIGKDARGFDTYLNERDGSVMVLVPAGPFRRGASDGREDEKPAHDVHLDAFYIDQFEVTVAQFERFVSETRYETDAQRLGGAFALDVEAGDWVLTPKASWRDPTYSQTADHPVVCVTYNDALAYATWAGKRLPTEAEWEKAASFDRFALTKRKRRYPWGDALPVRGPRPGNFADEGFRLAFPGWRIVEGYHDGFANAAPVGSFAAGVSATGALDMSGNVAEWCADWYGEAYYADPAARRNPRGPASGTARVVRGGSWLGIPEELRTTHRASTRPTIANTGTGFRCARTAEPAK